MDLEKYNLSRDEWSTLIDQWIFNERDRKILKRRLLDGVNFERLAEECGLTDRQVKNIVYSAKRKLFSKIQ